ncbi:MAG TPA: type II CAAX endopeptidase family protein [Gemmatimonadaceae bacterium]|nr:type II CAAX endopeptidase family protein [Gemmatimonadaceae bacterium]
MTKPKLFYDANGRLRTLWRVLAFVGLVIVFSVVAISMLTIVYGDPTQDVIGLILFNWAIVGGCVLAHLVMIRTVDKRSWSDVGLGSEHARPRYALLGIIVGLLAIALPMATLLAVGWLRIQPTQPGASIEFALIMLAFFIPAAFHEELMFRGYFFRVLRESWGWVPAAILTSVVFASAHSFNPNGCIPTMRAGNFDAQTCGQSLLLVTMAGIFLAAVVVYTGSLYAAWAAHFAWNWMMTGVLHAPVSGATEVIPGVNMPDFLMVERGPDVLTGGPWGPEGGLLAALSMVISILMLRRYARRIHPAEPHA